MYQSYLIEIPDVNEALEEINKAGNKIVSVTHIGDSQQLLLIVEDEERKSVLRSVPRRRTNREEVEGEQS